MKPRREPIFLILLMVASGLGGTGCAAGLAAVGPVALLLQAVGDRSVERTVSADLQTAWDATVDTLTRMEVRIRETNRDGEEWVLEGTGEAVTLHANLMQVTPQMTKVTLRVEAGGLMADGQTAEEILNQVALSLERSTPVAEREPHPEEDGLAEAVASLEEEIKNLKSAIEKKQEKKEPHVRRNPSPDATEMADAAVPRRSGIVVIPSTYGIPSLPFPAEATEGSTTREWPDEPATVGNSPPRAEAGRLDPRAAPLVPVDVLTPVRPLGGR